MNLAELIDIPGSIDGGRRALTNLGRSLSYQEVTDATCSAADKLRSYGLGASCAVAVIDANTPAQVMTLIALARLGACCVPSTPVAGRTSSQPCSTRAASTP